MTPGIVVGQVWGTRRASGLDGRRLLLVAPDGGGDGLVVAIDTLDARVGDHVLVSWGSGARNVLRPGPDNRDILADAAISLIVDGSS